MRAEGRDDATDPAQQTWNCMLGSLAQMRLQFAEGQFDRVEIWRIGRQIKQGGTCSLDCLLNTSDSVHRQIIHCNDVAGPERWDKALFHIGKKHWSVHGTLKHKRCRHPAQPQTSHKGDRFPMSMWCVANQSLTTGTATIEPHHLCMR